MVAATTAVALIVLIVRGKHWPRCDPPRIPDLQQGPERPDERRCRGKSLQSVTQARGLLSSHTCWCNAGRFRTPPPLTNEGCLDCTHDGRALWQPAAPQGPAPSLNHITSSGFPLPPRPAVKPRSTGGGTFGAASRCFSPSRWIASCTRFTAGTSMDRTCAGSSSRGVEICTFTRTMSK